MPAFDGTPGPGRPKGSRNGAAVAKEWAEKRGGWELIIRMVEGKEPNFIRATDVRARLAMYLIDRAFGKASQSVELSGPNGGPIDLKTILLDLARPKSIIDIKPEPMDYVMDVGEVITEDQRKQIEGADLNL